MPPVAQQVPVALEQVLEQVLALVLAQEPKVPVVHLFHLLLAQASSP